MGSNDGDNTLLVLHIDDDESFLEMTKLYLGRYFNFHVDTTTSPKNAISLLSDRSYDAVISDYQMPGMDGISLLKKIRHDLGMDVPFTLFTGKGREVIAMEALNLGANHYLQKGGDPKSMFAVLAETIIQEVNHNKTKKLVEANERKYRSIFESAKDAIFIMKDDKFIDCNNRTLELFNCSREEIIGVSPDKVSP
nr:response regulator [Candidatus Methanofastidiosa archaeon]